jgi:hypothetical protein
MTNSVVIPARGNRKAVVIAYDLLSDCLIIDGVKVSPELLTHLITDPDPTAWVSCEREGDVVTCRRQA